MNKFVLFISCCILFWTSCSNNSKKVDELLSKFEQKDFPFEIAKDLKARENIDLAYHDYLIFEQLFQTDSLTNKPSDFKPRVTPYLKFPSHKNYHLVVMTASPNESDFFGFTGLYTLSPDGKIIDKIRVLGQYGSVDQYFTIKATIDNNQEFRLIKQDWESNKLLDSVVTKYKIDETGKMIKLTTQEYKIESTETDINLTDGFIEGGSEQKCYRFESKVQTVTFSMFFFDKGVVHGEMFKDIHDEENGYFETFGLEFDGYINGTDLKVSGKDTGEDDPVSVDKNWTIEGNSIKIDDGIVVKLIDCALNKRPHEQK